MLASLTAYVVGMVIFAESHAGCDHGFPCMRRGQSKLYTPELLASHFFL